MIHNFSFTLSCLSFWADSFNWGIVNSMLCFLELSFQFRAATDSLTLEPRANHFNDLDLSFVNHKLERFSTLGKMMDNII